jgi:uncharacterized membrane protein
LRSLLDFDNGPCGTRESFAITNLMEYNKKEKTCQNLSKILYGGASVSVPAVINLAFVLVALRQSRTISGPTLSSVIGRSPAKTSFRRSAKRVEILSL